MKPKVCLYIIMLACFAGCAFKTENKKTTNAEHAEIREFLEDYYWTMSARDWPAYAAFFSGEATLTTIWQSEEDPEPVITTHTITEFLEQTGEGPDSQPVFEEKMVNAEIEIKKDLASAWVKYEAKFGSPDNLMEWTGYDLFSMIRHHNEWKIVSIVYAAEH
jgi:hypothetical protein